ncbi:MAG: hypothetical protein ACTTJ3_05570 [Treponema sp.]
MKPLFYTLLFFIVFGCTSTKIVIGATNEKELSISFFNDTPFAVDIMQDNPESLFPILHIEPKKTKRFTKLIYIEDEITSFFYAKLQVPVNGQVIPMIDYRYYRIESKNGLEQKVSISIEGALLKEKQYYIVLKNSSNKGIEVCNSSARSLYFSMDNTKSVPPKKSIVYSSKDRAFYTSHDKVSMLILYNGTEIPFSISSLQPSYIYTYEFNGKEVIKTDERPLLKVGEPLWKIEDDSLIIEKVIAKENSYYAVGRSKVLDENGNPYYCPYICCMNRETGNVQWEIKEKIVEGTINDALILENGDILTIGQSIVERSNVGAMWLYSAKGVLLNNKKCPECLSLNAISLNNNENATLVGFDEEEISFLSLSLNKLQYKPLVIQLPQRDFMSSAIPFYNQHSKSLFLFCNLVDEEERILSSKLYELKEDGKVKEISLQEKISSISSVVQTSTGTLYVGGETSRSEKSEAIILKIDGENLEVLYQDTRAFSYISSLHLNEESKELVASGVCKAKESSGVDGIPFISSLDIKTGKEVWRQDYKGMKYQLLRSFVPCLDYGFIASFSSILPSGEDYGSSSVLRLTSVGKTILGDK